MTALQQVKAAIVSALEAAGLAAMSAYSEERLKKYTTAVTAVGLREMKVTESGAVEYLGERYDAAQSTAREVYGKKLALSLSLDVYAPRTLGAEGCEEAAEEITQVMMSALPSGLRVRELKWGKSEWDKVYGMFRLSAQAAYEAYFVAETEEETAVFTDFILRGVVKTDEQYDT